MPLELVRYLMRVLMAKSETENSTSVIPDEVVISKIYLIREQKVMLDSDLAERVIRSNYKTFKRTS